MDKQRKIDFSIGIFDKITDGIIEKIKREAEKCELYGVGVYTDEIIIKEYMTYPVNTTEQRMKLVRQIEGVDFVFKLNNTDTKEVKKIIEQACREALKNK